MKEAEYTNDINVFYNLRLDTIYVVKALRNFEKLIAGQYYTVLRPSRDRAQLLVLGEEVQKYFCFKEKYGVTGCIILNTSFNDGYLELVG